MHDQKIRHPSNFRFARAQAHGALQLAGAGPLQVRVRDLGEDVFHVEFGDAARWPLDARLLRMREDAFNGASRHSLAFDADATLRLEGTSLVTGVPGACVGVCGSAWMVQLARDDGMRFHGRQAAVPYLLVRNGGQWIGLLVDHPGNVFMDTGSTDSLRGQRDFGAPASLRFGADEGVPAFYLIAGDSAASVTRRLQRLVGTTPLPPLWSLGHHQGRRGRVAPRELQALAAAFAEHEFPNDGLWLDIDEGEGYERLVTGASRVEGQRPELEALVANGGRVVPVLHPGVKVDEGGETSGGGAPAAILCRNPEGLPWVGFGWRGRTWLPDFSLPEARAWWAGHARQLRERGFGGAGIDTNDPDTGAAEVDDRRFRHGDWPHWTYRRLLETGMAQATWEGFEAAVPGERPFILSRSAAAGSSRWTALCTGGGRSSWEHLRRCIPRALDVALSGIPFNGPDVPGFAGHADAELAVAWYKAGMLFPFLRNHASGGTVAQEPWQFGPEALVIIRHCVRLRYKLLPYLYQLWVAQARDGTAVLRPLVHDFDGDAELHIDDVDDQFLVGPALMQAPLLHAGQQRRSVALPGIGRWMDAGSGEFIEAGRSIHASSDAASTPLYLREGHLLPMQPGERATAHNDLSDVELHVILGAGCTAEATLDYAFDDGLTDAHAQGERTVVRLRATRADDTLRVRFEVLQAGWKPLRLRVVGYDGATSAELALPGGTRTQALVADTWRFSGAPLAIARGEVIEL